MHFTCNNLTKLPKFALNRVSTVRHARENTSLNIAPKMTPAPSGLLSGESSSFTLLHDNMFKNTWRKCYKI